jgi:hypothetical protein
VTTYRGNTGNLLQHWVFCELVEDLRSEYGTVLISTTSMRTAWSPLARPGEHKQDRRSKPSPMVSRSQLDLRAMLARADPR